MGRAWKNTEWELPTPKVQSWEQAGVAVLMDIRDELQRLNALLGCQNFLDVPHILRRIDKNTTRPKRKVPRSKKP